MDYQQLDIFSYLQPQSGESPILLPKGQTVYIVNKADAIKYTATGETWIYEDCERGYRLIKEIGLYGVTNNEELGKTAFTDYEQTKQKADEYLKSHDGIILAGDIKPISTVAYSYIRDCDNREMTAFYCDLGDDMYYIKEFMTYAQLPKASLGATILTGGDLCTEDVADYIIANKSKQHSNFSNAYPLEVVECEQYEVDADTVGQYIGVKDKNRKEIYEGDIVRANSGRLCKVVWFSSSQYQGWYLTPIETKNPTPTEVDFWNNLEVIGNVYENADLLKEVDG